MKRLVSIIRSSLLISWSFIANAGDDIDIDQMSAGMETLKIGEDTDDRFISIINLPLNIYINEHPERRKLLLPCGHKPIEDPYYSTGLDQSYKIHEHRGWYTVDIDPKLEPDYVGDLNKQQSLDYIFQPETWDVIYMEYASYGHLTSNFFTNARQSLRAEGVIIFDPWINKISMPHEIIDKDFNCTIWLDSFCQISVPYLENGDLPKGESITQIEESLKPTFVKILGFSDIKLYVDTCLNDTWMVETTGRVTNKMIEEFNLIQEEYEAESEERQTQILSNIVGRERALFDEEISKVFKTTAIWNGETETIYQPQPLAYVYYPLILDQYDPCFRNMKKGHVFAIAKK